MNVIYARLMNEEPLFGFICPKKKQCQLETPAGESSPPGGKKNSVSLTHAALGRIRQTLPSIPRFPYIQPYV